MGSEMCIRDRQNGGRGHDEPVFYGIGGGCGEKIEDPALGQRLSGQYDRRGREELLKFMPMGISLRSSTARSASLSRPKECLEVQAFFHDKLLLVMRF